MGRFGFRRFVQNLSQLRFARFLLSGVANTVVTYAIYMFLLLKFSYQISYAVSYMIGILFAFFMNSQFVFKTHQGIRSLLRFPLIYLAQYLGGVVILWVWVEVLGLNQVAAPLVVVIVMLPITYILTRYVFLSGKRFT